ncbi:amine oxidase [Cystoisospora suis]|uniref:Amine oxidase n=1 Tax=Cystoisospora suis TaxID=483139 RepID=A0A2C6KU11_9APIC|nr:amine oxidase [Cystoisospora suis]
MVFGTRWIDGGGRTVNYARVALLSDVKDAVLERVRLAFLRQRRENAHNQADTLPEETEKEAGGSSEPGDRGKGENEDREMKAEERAGAGQERAEEGCTKQRGCCTIAEKSRAHERVPKARRGCRKKREERSVREEGSEEKQTTSPTGAEARSAKAVFSRTSTPQRNTNNQDYVTLRLRAKKEKREPSSQLRHRPSRCCEGTTNGGTLTVECTKPRLTSENSPQKVVVDRSQSSIPPFHPLGLLCPPFLATRRPEEKRGSAIADEKRTTMEPMLAEISPVRIYTAAVISASIYTKLPPLVLARIALMLPPFPLDPLGRPDANAAGADKRQPPCNFALQYLPLFPTASLHCLPSSLAARLLPPSETCQLPAGSVPVSPSCVIPSPTDSASLSAKAKPAEPVPPQLGGSSGALPSSLQQLETSTSPSTKAKSGSSSAPADIPAETSSLLSFEPERGSPCQPQHPRSANTTPAPPLCSSGSSVIPSGQQAANSSSLTTPIVPSTPVTGCTSTDERRRLAFRDPGSSEDKPLDKEIARAACSSYTVVSQLNTLKCTVPSYSSPPGPDVGVPERKEDRVSSNAGSPALSSDTRALSDTRKEVLSQADVQLRFPLPVKDSIAQTAPFQASPSAPAVLPIRQAAVTFPEQNYLWKNALSSAAASSSVKENSEMSTDGEGATSPSQGGPGSAMTSQAALSRSEVGERQRRILAECIRRLHPYPLHLLKIAKIFWLRASLYPSPAAGHNNGRLGGPKAGNANLFSLFCGSPLKLSCQLPRGTLTRNHGEAPRLNLPFPRGPGEEGSPREAEGETVGDSYGSSPPGEGLSGVCSAEAESLKDSFVSSHSTVSWWGANSSGDTRWFRGKEASEVSSRTLPEADGVSKKCDARVSLSTDRGEVPSGNDALLHVHNEARDHRGVTGCSESLSRRACGVFCATGPGDESSSESQKWAELLSRPLPAFSPSPKNLCVSTETEAGATVNGSTQKHVRDASGGLSETRLTTALDVAVLCLSPSRQSSVHSSKPVSSLAQQTTFALGTPGVPAQVGGSSLGQCALTSLQQEETSRRSSDTVTALTADDNDVADGGGTLLGVHRGGGVNPVCRDGRTGGDPTGSGRSAVAHLDGRDDPAGASPTEKNNNVRKCAQTAHAPARIVAVCASAGNAHAAAVSKQSAGIDTGPSVAGSVGAAVGGSACTLAGSEDGGATEVRPTEAEAVCVSASPAENFGRGLAKLKQPDSACERDTDGSVSTIVRPEDSGTTQFNGDNDTAATAWCARADAGASGMCATESTPYRGETSDAAGRLGGGEDLSVSAGSPADDSDCDYVGVGSGPCLTNSPCLSPSSMRRTTELAPPSSGFPRGHDRRWVSPSSSAETEISPRFPSLSASFTMQHHVDSGGPVSVTTDREEGSLHSGGDHNVSSLEQLVPSLPLPKLPPVSKDTLPGAVSPPEISSFPSSETARLALPADERKPLAPAPAEFVSEAAENSCLLVSGVKTEASLCTSEKNPCCSTVVEKGKGAQKCYVSGFLSPGSVSKLCSLDSPLPLSSSLLQGPPLDFSPASTALLKSFGARQNSSSVSSSVPTYSPEDCCDTPVEGGCTRSSVPSRPAHEASLPCSPPTSDLRINSEEDPAPSAVAPSVACDLSSSAASDLFLPGSCSSRLRDPLPLLSPAASLLVTAVASDAAAVPSLSTVTAAFETGCAGTMKLGGTSEGLSRASTSFSVHAGSLAPSLSESSGGPAPASVSAASLAPVFSSADSSPLRKGELPPQHGSSTARHVPGCSSAGASCAVPVSSLDSGESVPAASAPGFVSLGACNSSHPPFRSVCSRPGSEPVCSSCLSTSPARLTPGVCDVSSHVLHCSTSCRDAPDTVRSLISTPVPLARSRASAQSSSITSETSSKTSDASPRSSVGMVREFPSGEATDTSSDPSLRSPTSSSSSPNPLSPGPVVNSCQAGSPFRSLVNTKSITGPSSGGTPAHGGAPLRDANNPSPNKYSLCPQRQPPAGQASPSQSSDPFVSLLASPIPTQCSLLLPTLETHGPASRRPLSFSAPSEQKELGASCRAEAVGRGESHDSKARCDSRLYASSELPRSAPRGASWKYRTGGGFRLEGCHVAECKIDCTNLKTAVLSAWACIRDHKNLPPGLVSFLQEKRTQADAQFTCRDTPLLARKPGRDQEGVAEAKKKKAFQPATYVADDCQVLGPGNGGDSEVFPRPTSEGDERSRRRVNEVNSVKPERAKSTSPSTPCSAVGCSTGGLRRSECSSRVDQLAMSDALVHKCGRQATLEDTSLGPSVSVRTSCRPAAGTTGETYADVEKRLSLPGGGDSSQRGKFTASLQGISETSVGKRAEHVGVLSRKRRAPTAKGRGGVLELKPEDSGPTATLQEDSFSDCQSKGASRDKRRRTKQDAHLMCREGQTVVKVTQEDKVLESSPRSSPSDLDNFSAETPGDRQLPSQGSPCSEGASLLCTSSSPETSSPYKLSALSHLERVARPIPGAEIFPVSWSAQVDLRQQDAQAGGDNESPSAAGGEAFLRQPAERRENRAGSEAVGGSSFSRLTSSRYWEKADEEIILKMVQRSFGYVCDLAEVSVEDLVGGSDEDAEEVSIKIPEGLLRGKTMRSGVAECRKSEKPGKTDYSAKQCVKKENEKNSSALRSGAADGIGERRQTISGTVEKSVATRGQSDQGQPYETKAKGKTAGRQASDKHDAMGPGVITEEDQGTTNKKKGDGKRSRRSHFPFLTPENYKQLGSRESTLLARRRLDGTPTPHMFEPEAADGDRLFADGYKWLPTLLIQTFGLLDCAVLGYQARHISLVPAKCEDSARVMESNSQLPSLLSDWTSKLPCHSPERREDSLQDASQHEGQSKGRKNKPSDGNDSSSSEVESDVETACTILKSALGFSGMDKSTRVDCGSATATRIDQFGLETPGGYSRNLKVLSGSLRTLPGEETEQHASEESGMTCRSTVLPEKAHTETEFHVGCSAKTHGSDRESTSTHSRDGIPGSSVAEELESHEAYVNACANDPLYWPWVGLPYSGVRISLRRYYNNVEGGRRADTQLDMQASLSACGGNNGDTERCASALTSGKAQKEEQSLPSVAGPQRCFASAPASLPLSGGRVEEPAAGVAEHAEARERTELSGCKRKEEKDEKTRIADPGKKVCSEKEQTDSEDERVPPKGVLEKVKGSQLPGRTDGQETERNVPTAVPVGEPRNGENETTEREGNVTGAGDNRTGTIATPILRQQDTVNREDSIREERQPRDHTDEQEEEDSTGGRHTEVALAAGVQGPLLYAPEEQNPQCLPKQESSGSGPKRDQATSKQNVSQIESEAATRKHDKYESSSCECMYAEDVYALKCIVAVPIGVLKKNVITFSPPLSSEKQAAIRRWGAGSHNKVVLRFTEVFWPPSAPFLNPSFTPLFQFMNLHAFGKANCLVAHSFGNYRWDFVRRLRERRKVRRSARRKSTGSRGDCFLLDFPSKRVTGSLFQSEAETKRESGVMGRIDNMAGGNDETASVADTENLAAVTSCPWVRGTMQESSGGFTCESRATEEASRKSACFSEQHRNGNAQLPLPQRVSGTDPTIEVPCCGAALRSSRSRSDLGGGGQSSHFSGHSVDDQPSHGKKSDNESELDGTLSSAEDDWDEADHWELWAERNEVSSSGQKNHTRKRVSDQEVVDECCLVLKRMFNLKKKPWPVQAIVTRWDEDPLYYCSYGFPSKETQERDQQLLSQPHPWAPSVPLPVKKFLRPADRPLGGKGKEKGLGNQSGCCDATEAMENKRCSPGENERPRTSKSTKSKGGCRNAPDGLLEAQFVNSLSDSLVYFCGEHTSDFGQQCVHGAMHSGARAAAECLASLLKCDGVPWCQSDWGLTQNMGTEGPSTRSADPDCGCSPGRSSEDVRLSETADERAAYGSGKDFSLRKGTRTESGYAAAHRSKAQDDVGTTVIDEWKTWWYGSDGAFVYGRDGSATHSAPRDVFLRKALTREQRVGILRRRISEFVNAMGANEDASESA